VRCEAITQAGSRCRLDATAGATWCYSHDPARVEERRRNARKAGRSGGNGRAGTSELAGIKRDIRGVLDGVLDGRIDRGAGACAAQLLNVLLRAVELERKIREADELEGRLRDLERALTDTGGGRALWGG
jgi:hypothetical protein